MALGLFNSVVSAFYYVRVLKAMFLREPGDEAAGAARAEPIARADRAGNDRGGDFRDRARLAHERDAGAAVTMLTEPVILPEDNVLAKPPSTSAGAT